MTWVKIDDGFWMHPKVARAGNESAGIFCRCLAYCGAYLTDGLVPEQVAVLIAGSKAKLEAVIEAGLLERTHPQSGSVYVRDYSDYNPLRSEVEAEKEARAERGRKGAEARYGKNNGRSHARTNA